MIDSLIDSIASGGWFCERPMNDQDTLFYYATHDLEAEATSPKQQQKVPKSKKKSSINWVHWLLKVHLFKPSLFILISFAV